MKALLILVCIIGFSFTLSAQEGGADPAHGDNDRGIDATADCTDCPHITDEAMCTEPHCLSSRERQANLAALLANPKGNLHVSPSGEDATK